MMGVAGHRCITFALLLMLSVQLAACGSARDDSVWNSYEYRYAPPSIDNDAGYTPPQGYGGYGYGQDNDSAYTPPRSDGGMCSPDNPQMCL